MQHIISSQFKREGQLELELEELELQVKKKNKTKRSKIGYGYACPAAVTILKRCVTVPKTVCVINGKRCMSQKSVMKTAIKLEKKNRYIEP